MRRAECDAVLHSGVTPEEHSLLKVDLADVERPEGAAATREQWMNAAATFYADALRLAALPNPEDEDHDGCGAECDAYWKLSDEIEEAGADAGLSEAEMTALIAAADSEHVGGSSLAGAAAITDLAAERFGARQ